MYYGGVVVNWDKIMKIRDPHEALKAIDNKIDAENLSIEEMEARIYEYANLHHIYIDEMAFYPNGGRVLDPNDILTIEYEEQLKTGVSGGAKNADCKAKSRLFELCTNLGKIINQGKISYYTADGTLKEQQELNNENIGNTNGMMLRCFMQNGTIHEGFSDPYRTHGKPPYDGGIHDFIYLWTWDYLDEKTHKLIGDDTTKFDQTFVPVPIHEIIRIDAILFSNPRWGGKLTNRFFVDIS